MQRAVQKCLTDRHVVNDIATPTFDARAFTVPVDKFVKRKIEIRFLEKVGMEQYENLSNKAVVNHKAKTEDGFPPHKMY